MNLETWLRLLGKKIVARYKLFKSTTYPVRHLLPRPSYRLLQPPHQIVTGWLLRRTEGKNVFAPAANGRQVLQDPKQLCKRPHHLTGFSVNLWGQFMVKHAGWVPKTKEASEKMGRDWQPWQPVKPPTATEIHYQAPETWDAVVFDLFTLNGRPFDVVEFGTITASVCHAPNCWNYWHYEVRFQDAQGHWLHRLSDYNPVPYKNKRLERLQSNLLASFIQAGLAQPVAAIPVPIPLPRTVYDTRPPWWSRLLGR